MTQMLPRSISWIVAVVATLAATALATCLAAAMPHHSPASAPAVVVLREDPTHLSQERTEATAQPTYQRVDATVRTRSTEP
jgi:anti-sigma-K factor RskA